MDDESFDLVASLELKYGPSWFMQNASAEKQDQKVYPISFPLDEKSLYQVPPGYLTHFLRIMKVFEKIQELNRLFTMKVCDSSCRLKMSALIQDISTSLHNWNNSFTYWLERTGSLLVLADNSTVSTNSSWNITYLEIFYHFCVICLHRPQILDDSMNNRDLIELLSDSRLRVCNAAFSMSDILNKYDLVELVRHVHPFIHTLIFQLGITYAVLMVGGRHLDQFERYKQELEISVSRLARLSRIYFLARSKCDILRNIYNSLAIRKSLVDHKSNVSLIAENFRNGYPPDEYNNSLIILNSIMALENDSL
jgi:hypothetical protein